MLYQFILQNLHFALNLFVALIFLSIFWLHYDAWLEKRTPKEMLRFIGFALLAISFLLHAASVESSLFESGILATNINTLAFVSIRSLAYILIAISLAIDPILPHPLEGVPEAEVKVEVKKKPKKKKARALLAFFNLPLAWTQVILAPLCLYCGYLYYRRATVGYERHLKPLAKAFFILGLTELISFRFFFQGSENIDVYKAVRGFGPLWILEHAFVFLAVFVLRKWLFGYLLKRFVSQLLIIFTSLILAVFVFVTLAFTALLLKNFQDASVDRVETDARVLELAIESKKAEILSDAQLIAQDPQVRASLGSSSALSTILEDFLLTKDFASLVVIDKNGKVVGRGEDKERVGEALSGDHLVKKALEGEAVSSISVDRGPLSPIVSVSAAAPIKGGGAVLASEIIDNAFLDGVKKATGLDASVYGENVLSATTLVAQDQRSRFLGIKEEKDVIKEKVLAKGEDFKGSVAILGRPYLAAYLPLKDVEGKTVGMLFVGQEQIGILRAAGASIRLTFLLATGLLVLSIFPAYFLSRYISSQL